MKILFLDIDGVINCMVPTPSPDHEWVDLNEWRYGFNPQLVARLRYVIAKTNCRIVVSSSWRHHETYAPYRPDRNWRDVLSGMIGIRGSSLFVGETPTDRSGQRGIEIGKWLLEHSDEVDSWCVVDDETVDIVPYLGGDRVVKTDMTTGMTMEDAKRMVEILNRADSN